jgi:hypothetical protein
VRRGKMSDLENVFAVPLEQSGGETLQWVGVRYLRYGRRGKEKRGGRKWKVPWGRSSQQGTPDER